jgi:hypothetical protein
MKKCINGQYIEMTQEEIDEFNSNIDSSYVPTIEDRVTALEESYSPAVVSSVVLLADNWTGETSPYSQVVDIEGVTASSMVDLQFNADQVSVFHEKDVAFVAENNRGEVTVYCIGQKPVNDYQMQATVTEVHKNG